MENLIKSEGGTTRVSDLDGGILAMELPEPRSAKGRAFLGGALGKQYVFGPDDRLEVAINLSTLSTKEVLARVSFQRIFRSGLGTVSGEEILTPKLYAEFYNRLESEMERARVAPESDPKEKPRAGASSHP